MDNKITVSVKDFGAVAGSDELQSPAIQKALDHVFLEGGGEVQIPGGVYKVGGLRVRSNTTLHLLENAVLEGSRDPEDYSILKNDKIEPVDPAMLDDSCWKRVGGAPEQLHKWASRWHNGLIRAYHAENIAIIGEKGSLIDGKNCYDALGEEFYRGPQGISIVNCENIVLRGYKTKDTGNWAQSIWNSNNILVENVINEAGHDGVHITTCEDVIIRNCEFYTGDDCVAGYNNKNVLVEDCEINSACSAFRFSATNALIHHCHIFSPPKFYFRGRLTKEEKEAGIPAIEGIAYKDCERTMLSVFTYYAELATDIYNLGANITIRDCLIENADRFLNYNYSGNAQWQLGQPMLDIKFSNIKASGIVMPSAAYGDPEKRVSVTFENVDFSFKEGCEDTTFLLARYYDKIKFKNVTVRNGKCDHLVKSFNSEKNGDIEFINTKTHLSESDLVKHTDETFEYKAI